MYGIIGVGSFAIVLTDWPTIVFYGSGLSLLSVRL